MHKLAILDMNAGVPNQGLRCLKQIATSFAGQVEFQVFDVRANNELPDTSHDIYLCSGGPGSPLATGEIWEREFFHLLDELWDHNQHVDDPAEKKYVFFICYSFQLASRYFSSGNLTRRRSMSFGTFPVHSSNDGDVDPLFVGLEDPFYVADFRDFQVVRPNYSALSSVGASVLAFEKIREHVPYERAVMAVRWSPEWVGTQFHPEADSEGMIVHFNDTKRKAAILDEHGQEKYEEMMSHLADPNKIQRTHEIIIPGFIRRALHLLSATQPMETV